MNNETYDDYIANARQFKLLQFIDLLKADCWTAKQLAKRFDTTPMSIYRYVKMLDILHVPIDKDKAHRFFIVPDASHPGDVQLCMEERKFLRAQLQTTRRSPLQSWLLKKMTEHIKSEKGPRIFTDDNNHGRFVEVIAKALRSRHQLSIIQYHSGNSQVISDRLVEPICFGDNYQTLYALDTKDGICKQFRLDRMTDVIEKRTRFKHEPQHKEMISDCFGFTGNTVASVTLQLGFRAYLKLKEDYPLAAQYIKQTENGYIFKGPVSSFEGVGVFVFSQLRDLTVTGPIEFEHFIRKGLSEQTLLRG